VIIPAHHPPVDIVYLWVNGSDRVWRAKRRLASGELSGDEIASMAIYSNVDGRFRDNDELRYSLRALERFFPGHGHVYIVTDGQTPAWLKPSSRLSIVDHKDLIPAASLPTFDSGNIESYIHRIPNLSERYFYLNDDIFFGSPVDLNDWFWDDGFYVGWSDEKDVSDEAMRPDSNALENACRFSSRWFASNAVFSKNYEHTFRTFSHSPRPMLRSIVYAAEKAAPEWFAAVRSTVFRQWNKPPVISDFVMRFALAQGQAKVRNYEQAYVATGDPVLNLKLLTLAAVFEKLHFFCINDTTDDAKIKDPRLLSVKTILQDFFWWPSSFEIETIPSLTEVLNTTEAGQVRRRNRATHSLSNDLNSM
jgi:Stealth protein CR2, conserved region 2/Stealth protein CR1, conserved region 1